MRSTHQVLTAGIQKLTRTPIQLNRNMLTTIQICMDTLPPQDERGLSAHRSIYLEPKSAPTFQQISRTTN